MSQHFENEWLRLKEIVDTALSQQSESPQDYVKRACGDDLVLYLKITELLFSADETNLIYSDSSDDLDVTTKLPPADDYLETEDGLEKQTLINSPNAHNLTQKSTIGRPNLTIGASPTVINSSPSQQLKNNEPMIKLSAATRTTAQFPVSNWQRYECIEMIGEGGMGRVYKARDPRLNRFVAIKFLLFQSDELSTRFIREAKMQAKIEHENICKIYEVGEVKGHLFIAMQYIDGQSLDKVRNQLSLEEKVKVIRDVTAGIQAAHKLGLIHRDLKPANIMVEQSVDGMWKPYILDFGVARDSDKQELTQAGMPIGTPAYMSPEQAKGDKNIDRRTDIYSLGATFYAILTGAPLFTADNLAGLLKKAIEAEPQPLRKLLPDIPTDLEIIIMKCLEKEPVNRYESARSLCQDLDHYLNGEPIQARGQNWSYTWRKRAVKHKRLLTILSLTAFTIFCLLGWNIHSQWQANRRVVLAQQFGQQIKEIEYLMRLVYTMPLHDIRSERARVQQLLRKIESQMAEDRSIAEGPGYYALGRGYLALQDYGQARNHLEKAWQLGYQQPEVAYALGQVMGELYRAALERSGGSKEDQARIEAEYLAPALRYLELSRKNPTESPAFLDAKIAFYRKNYSEALTKVAEAYKESPGLYEAQKLAGDTYLQLGNDMFDREDVEQAREFFNQADAAYHQASEIARSEPAIYTAQAYCARLKLYLTYDEQSTEKLFKQARELCDKALQADPENAAAYGVKSLIYTRQAQITIDREQPPASEKAIELAKQAILYAPQLPNSYNALATAYFIKASNQFSKGYDATETINRAVENYQLALTLAPNDGSIKRRLADTYNSIAFFYLIIGRDPTESSNRALEIYSDYYQDNPSSTFVIVAMTLTTTFPAIYEIERGRDCQRLLDRIAPILNERLLIEAENKITVEALYLMKQALLIVSARYKALIGVEPKTEVEAAIKNYQILHTLFPKKYPAGNIDPYIFLHQARYLIQNGQDPTAVVTSIKTSMQNIVQLPQTGNELSNVSSEIELIIAQWEITQNRSPIAQLQIARQQGQNFISRYLTYPYTHLFAARVELTEAMWKTNKGISANKEIAAGLREIEQALKINANLPEAIAVQGLLNLLAANNTKDLAARTTQQQLGNQQLAKAYQLNPHLKKIYHL